ncbi:MAG: hypothetical protein QOG38_2513 [Hyphomicrobiales bacterium]|nr:hypothetical protein [Hyphomicrobiales bacterium]
MRFRRIIASCLALALTGASAQAQDVPVPQPRPVEAGSATPEVPVPQPRPDVTAAPSTVPSAPSACRGRLTADVAIVEALPPVTGADGCGIEDPVLLSTVLTKEKKRVAISPPVVLGCAMAEALALWLREDVVDIASSLGAPLSGLSSGQGYQCRGRNGIAGAPTSQHGRGNAMDLRAILLANGTSANPTDTTLPKEFRERIKVSACAHFTTVLGPGSDGHHDIYIHLDVAPRRSGARICQWVVHGGADAIPLPRERPAAPPPRADAR